MYFKNYSPLEIEFSRFINNTLPSYPKCTIVDMYNILRGYKEYLLYEFNLEKRIVCYYFPQFNSRPIHKGGYLNYFFFRFRTLQFHELILLSVIKNKVG